MSTGWEKGQDRAKFGPLEFDIERASDTYNRAVRVVEYDGVDGAQLVDQGARPRSTQVTAVFADAEQISQFQSLLALNDGRPQLFVHPLLGAYEARITELRTAVIASETRIVAEITFLEEGDADDVLVIDEPLDVGSGLSAVTVRSEQAMAAIDRLPRSTTAPGLTQARQAAQDAPATVASWQGDLSAIQVQTQLSASLASLDHGLHMLEAESTVEASDAHLALLRLRSAVAETAAQRGQPRTTVVRVVGATPALTFALDRGQSERFAQSVLDLNPAQSPLAFVGRVEVPV